jgi:AcrR family transcriptional regulator
MPPPELKPPKGRRDPVATRSAILAAATRRFAFHGYAYSGVREIAADAGVTGPMVNRYFGSKEGLFAEVLKRAFSDALVEYDRATLADRLARMLVYGPGDAADDRPIRLLLWFQSSIDPHASELLEAASKRTRTNQQLLAECIGGHDAEVRAAMTLAQCVGFSFMYRVSRSGALTGAQQEQLVALLTESLAASIG